MEEIWRDIEGYVGIYMISNRGRVKSFCRGKERILNPMKDKNGYLYINLYKNKKYISKKIHLLVWDAFGDSHRNGRILQVDHIDNNKENNCIENLQLLSARENSSKKTFKKEKSSKYTGVYWDKQLNKWKAGIRINGKQKHLGYFPTQEEAAEAYLKAKESL